MSFEEVSNLIQSRQSLYPKQMIKGAIIDDQDIWKLLENANYAPSHKRTEPWRYIVFPKESLPSFFTQLSSIYKTLTPTKDFKKEKFSKFNAKSESLSHVIAICMKRDELERVPIEEEEYAVVCSVQNILLSMKSLNIAGYWGSGKLIVSEEMKSYLKLEQKDKCLGILQLGVPKDNLLLIEKKQNSSIHEKVEWR